MCFGDTKETTTTTTQSIPAWLESAAQSNVARATALADKGVTPYTAPMTAGLTGNQQDAFGLIKSIAGSENPYLSDIEGLYSKFANTGPSAISPASILGGDADIRSASIKDYMNPYTDAVLNPQLRDITRQGVAQRQALDADATMSGAFGDARSGIERASQRRNEEQLRTDTIGKAYSDAFSAAAGLRGTDVGNLMSADTTNVNLLETALQRAITGGKAMTDLDRSQVDRGLSTAGALAGAGATEQATEQAGLSANYQEFLRQQGWDADQIKMLASVIGTTPYPKTSESTKAEEDNSGFGILGSLGAALIMSDRRVKREISVVGALLDGTPVYRFKYVGSDAWRIGLMAQDVEKIRPDAVVEVNGIKAVDYGKATENSLVFEAH